MLPLPSAWTYEAELPSEAIIPGFWDSAVSAISRTSADTVHSSLPQHGPRELISVPRCCISTYFFADGPNGPRHGSGSRPRFLGQDIRDLGACLRYGIAD